MKIRTTDNVTDLDVTQIYDELKKYNLSKREPTEKIPIGIFIEDDDGNKQAGLIGETVGNWLLIRAC